jgi:hypothetical protein
MPAKAGIHDFFRKKQEKKQALLFVNKKKQKNFVNYNSPAGSLTPTRITLY